LATTACLKILPEVGLFMLALLGTLLLIGPLRWSTYPSSDRPLDSFYIGDTSSWDLAVPVWIRGSVRDRVPRETDLLSFSRALCAGST